MPCGAHQRGTKETLSVLAEAVASNPNTLLVIDEIDKIYQTDNSWMGYIRGEIYELCDGRWPTGLQMPDDDSTEMTIAALTSKLRNTVFIVGIGTFQDFFDSSISRRAIGFGAETNPASDELTAEIVAQKLPRELANRFNSTLIRIPDLQAEDYHRIALEAANKLPAHMQAAFRLEVSRRIDAAISTKKGVRFLEECAMETLKNHPETESAPGIPILMDDL
jgi:ATP-dependent Clp protease ATP-binding subunit ClpA